MAIVSRSFRITRVLLTVALVAVSPPGHASEWTYTVRPGDEIWNIASRYCGSPSFASRIIEFNQLADERLIRPGSRLRIPVAWLVRQPVTAEVLNVRGNARLLTPDPEPARVGRRIEMGYRLQTEDGAVVVGFADGSSLFVAAESEVLFNVLTAYGDTGMVDTHLRFYRGRGSSTVIRRNDASSFRISSPAGTAAVRGTEFRVAADADQSLTETLEGEVGFIRDTETPVPAGYGLAASAAGDIREPLLAAPTWTSGPGRHAIGTDIRWQPLTGARAYRASVYLASDPQTPVQVSITETEALRLAGLPPAPYHIAVRGISNSDLEGYESTLDIVLTTPAPEPTSPTILTTGATVLQWRTSTSGPYEIEVARDQAFRDVIWHEQVGALEASPRLAPGHYHWRVRTGTSDFGPASSIVVRPAAPGQPEFTRANLQLGVGWSHPGADAFRIRVSRDAAFSNTVIDTELRTPFFEDKLPTAGSYHVEITATTNGVASEPTRAEVSVFRRPWWLLGFLVVPFLL